MRIVGLILLGTLALTACKREGCTEEEAVNYDEKAKQNDGSCKYEATVVWWYDEATADWLANTVGTSNVKVKIDNIAVATSLTTEFWTAAPSCSDAGAMSYLVEMYNIKQETFDYIVQDQAKNTQWSGTITASPNDCQVIELD